MTVLLRRANDLVGLPADVTWVCLPGGDALRALPAESEMTGVSAALEDSFDRQAEQWWTIGRALSRTESAGLAHTPACVANASDFGQMLAWSALVQRWASESRTVLVVCGDPWLFRHLRSFPGVTAGRSPPLWPDAIRLWLRGRAARWRVAVRLAAAALAPRTSCRNGPAGRATILVYGHPASTGDGYDGYFGTLMGEQPAVRRMLHTDCPPDGARKLAGDGRTASLHGYGNPLFALTLGFARWRPTAAQRRGPHGWLVRRAAAREGGTGQAATIRWQLHCQRRWLKRCRPAVVAWPWENHAWERDLVRAARRLGIRTIGYQHSVIGRQMLNYAPRSNPDGLDSLPDRIFCTGPATRRQLAGWSVPEDRLEVAGAYRFVDRPVPARDDRAPVFVALPFDGATAAEMVGAARRASRNGLRFVIKDHPMTGFAFDDSPGVTRTDLPLEKQPSVSAVVYAATTVGLEAAIGGLPTFRFRPRGRIALDILPAGFVLPTIDGDSLASVSHAPAAQPEIRREDVFAPIDAALWRDAFKPTDRA